MLESAQLALRYSPKELKQFPLAALGWVYFKRRDFKSAVDFLTKSADLGPTPTNLMHLGMALLESGEKDRARQVFRRAKSFKIKGAGLEEKILEQVRTATKLIDRLHRAAQSREDLRSSPVCRFLSSSFAFSLSAGLPPSSRTAGCCTASSSPGSGCAGRSLLSTIFFSVITLSSAWRT